MSEDIAIVIIGCLVVVLGFLYTGSFNRAFGRGRPDNPPTLQMRVVLVSVGIFFIVFGLVRAFKAS